MSSTKRKTSTGSYLILHRSGTVAKTKTLSVTEPVEGITAIINLDTLEQYKENKWEKIPDGYAPLIEAEADVHEQLDAEDEYTDSLQIQVGAKRLFDPQVVWAYCTTKFKIKSTTQS